MMNDKFGSGHGDSYLPLSIEEFAAYLDGNLSDDGMRRMSLVIENDEGMQEVMDGVEQSELTLASYTAEDLRLPEDLKGTDFLLPRVGAGSVVGNRTQFNPYQVAACCSMSPAASAGRGSTMMFRNMSMEMNACDFAPAACEGVAPALEENDDEMDERTGDVREAETDGHKS